MGGIAQLLVLALYPIVFPPTQPLWVRVRPNALWEGAATVAASAVAMRSGGVRAVALITVFELATVAAQFPARSFACARSGFALDIGACDYTALLLSHWHLWASLAAGLVVSRWLNGRPAGNNLLLRGAGVLALSVSIAGSVGVVLLFLVVLPNSTSGPMTGPAGEFGATEIPSYLTVVAAATAAVIAGATLRGRPLAAPLIVALAFSGASVASGAVLLRGQVGVPGIEPLPMLFARFFLFIEPAVACVGLFGGWLWGSARLRHRT